MTAIGDELWRSLGPWYRADVNMVGQPLRTLANGAISGLQPVEDIIRDTDTHPGWSVILDPDLAPVAWLPWLAQFGGKRIPAGLTEAAQRAYIKGTGGTKRGTPGALVEATRQHLTGTKRVYLVERRGSAYAFAIATMVSETPDTLVTHFDILAQKPAGLVLTYDAITGTDYESLAMTHSSYLDLSLIYPTYLDIPLDPTRQA